MPRFAVIIPAAGRSVRFGRDKLLEDLLGEPVLIRTLRAFVDREDVPLIVVACPGDGGFGGVAGVAGRKVVQCPGGPSRAASVLNALERVGSDIEWVAVHDAARPLVSQDLVDRTFAAAVARGAAVPALPVALTIKEATGPLPARVGRTVPRDRLWAVQTPQVMRREALLDAFERCPIPLERVTDDVQLLELSGRDVWLVPGEERNLKITTPLDLELAELLIRRDAAR
jgi:2-C-methyl-D-erythritol 4-phosphate cytidylyltransferase